MDVTGRFPLVMVAAGANALPLDMSVFLEKVSAAVRITVPTSSLLPLHLITRSSSSPSSV